MHHRKHRPAVTKFNNLSDRGAVAYLAFIDAHDFVTVEGVFLLPFEFGLADRLGSFTSHCSEDG